jgi:hypothetical protein
LNRGFRFIFVQTIIASLLAPPSIGFSETLNQYQPVTQGHTANRTSVVTSRNKSSPTASTNTQISSEQQAPYLLAYQIVLSADQKSALQSLPIINEEVRKKNPVSFDSNGKPTTTFLNTNLGRSYQNAENYLKVANTFNSCAASERAYDFVPKIEEYTAYEGGRPETVSVGLGESYTSMVDQKAVKKTHVVEPTELNLVLVQERLLETARAYQKEELERDCFNINPDILQTPSLDSLLDVISRNNQNLIQEKKYDSTNPAINFQKDFIAQNIDDSVYGYLHFMRTFSKRDHKDLNSNGDATLEATVTNFCNVSKTEWVQTSPGVISYGGRGGYAPPQGYDKTFSVDACSASQKEDLKKHYEDGIKKLNRNKIAYMDAATTAKKLKERLDDLNKIIREIEALYPTNYLNNIGIYHLKLKKKVKPIWDEYQRKYHELLGSPEGVLLQTDDLKKIVGASRNLEGDGLINAMTGNTTQDNSVRLWSLTNKIDLFEHGIPSGAQIEEAIKVGQTKILKQAHQMYEDFNSLESERAAYEFNKTDKNYKKFQEKRMEKLAEMFQANPGALGKLIAKNPEHAALVCEVAIKLGEDKAITSMWDKVYMGAAFATGALMIATGVGAVAGVSAIAATATALGTSVEVARRAHVQQEKAQKQGERLSSSYIAGTGDHKTLIDIKALENEYKSRQFEFWSTSLLGPLDLIGVGTTMRVAKNLYSFNKFSTSLSDAGLAAKAAQLRKAHTGFLGNGKFGKFIGDLSNADEATQAKFLEKLKSWNPQTMGSTESIAKHFEDIAPELAAIGSQNAENYEKLRQFLGEGIGSDNRNLYAGFKDPKYLEGLKSLKNADVAEYNKLLLQLRSASPEDAAKIIATISTFKNTSAAKTFLAKTAKSQNATPLTTTIPKEILDELAINPEVIPVRFLGKNKDTFLIPNQKENAVYIGVSSTGRTKLHYYLIAGNKRFDGRLLFLKKNSVYTGKRSAPAQKGVLFELEVGADKVEEVRKIMDDFVGKKSLLCINPTCKILDKAGIGIGDGIAKLNYTPGKTATDLINRNIIVDGVRLKDDQLRMLATAQEEIQHYLDQAQLGEKAFFFLTTVGGLTLVASPAGIYLLATSIKDRDKK